MIRTTHFHESLLESQCCMVIFHHFPPYSYDKNTMVFPPMLMVKSPRF